jgi:hypothetical protein
LPVLFSSGFTEHRQSAFQLKRELADLPRSWSGLVTGGMLFRKVNNNVVLRSFLPGKPLESSLNIEIMGNGRLLHILVGAVVILFVPLVAMLFTKEVKWTYIDFLVAGILLVGTGLVLELILRKVKEAKYKLLASFVLLIMIVLIWAELSVGIFGTPIAGN